MRILKIFLGVILFIAFCSTSLIYTKEFKFVRYSVVEGLPNNFSLYVMQDSEGYLWIGTSEGLCRFDGYNFVTFNEVSFNPISLSSSQVYCVLEDQADRIWIGTYGGGVDIYNKLTGELVNIGQKVDNPVSLSSNNVTEMVMDHNGYIWVGTESGGIQRINPKDYSIQNFPLRTDSGLIITNVNSFFEDSQNRLWIGTHDGLFRYNSERTEYEYFSATVDKHSLNNIDIECIYEDREGIIWVGSRAGLNRYNPSEGNFLNMNNLQIKDRTNQKIRVLSLFEDRDSNFWVGTHSGLFLFDKGTWELSRLVGDSDNIKLLSGKSIWTITEDRNGALWIASLGGVFRFDRKNPGFRSYYIKDLIGARSESGHITSLLKVDDLLYVGTKYFGIFKYLKVLDRYIYSPDTEKISKSLKGKWVMGMIQSKDGTLWVATRDAGLSKLNSGEMNFYNYISDNSVDEKLKELHISALYEDREGTIWIGTDGKGIIRLNPISGEIQRLASNLGRPDSLKNNAIMTFYDDSRDNFWVGTYGGGLGLLDRTTNTFRHFVKRKGELKSISSNAIVTLKSGKGGFLWIGTFGGGLNRFDPGSESFKHYIKKDGLPSNAVYSIQIDSSDNIWMGTSYGLSKFNPGIETFINYFDEDGLQGNEFTLPSLHDKRTGEMIFGGVNGFTVFSPDKILNVQQKPSIKITYIERFGKANQKWTNWGEESTLYLSYKDSFLIGFSILDFSDPGQKRYSYMIERGDKDWINIGSSDRLTFDSMAPGNYRLLIKGVDKNGIWSEPTSLKIVVIPPFWQTWWFRGILFFLLMGIIIQLYRINLKRAIRKMEYKSRIEYFCKKSGLSDRECEVLGLLIEGKSNKEIEDILFISSNTVRNHVYNIYQKLKINSRVQLLKQFENSGSL